MRKGEIMSAQKFEPYKACNSEYARAAGGDMTYCGSDCHNERCYRHKSHIDWNLPKHAIIGASMSDFSKKCTHYVGK